MTATAASPTNTRRLPELQREQLVDALARLVLEDLERFPALPAGQLAAEEQPAEWR